MGATRRSVHPGPQSVRGYFEFSGNSGGRIPCSICSTHTFPSRVMFNLPSFLLHRPITAVSAVSWRFHSLTRKFLTHTLTPEFLTSR